METPPPTPPSDPHETQAVPVTPLPNAPATPPPGGGYLPAPGTPVPGSTAVRYEHPFGNLGLYLLGRFGAFVVDIVIVTFVLASFGLQLSTGGSLAFGGHDEGSFTLLTLAALGAASLLLVVSEGVFGTSLGKLVFALHVRRSNGNWAGPGRALLRMILRPFDLLVIGPILALVTPRHQRARRLLRGHRRRPQPHRLALDDPRACNSRSRRLRADSLRRRRHDRAHVRSRRRDLSPAVLSHGSAAVRCNADHVAPSVADRRSAGFHRGSG